MKTFRLLRHEDETGLSGTGYVAEGVQFTDGTVALRWLTDTPTTEILPTLEVVMKLHGHEGKTALRFTSPDYGVLVSDTCLHGIAGPTPAPIVARWPLEDLLCAKEAH